MLRIVVDYENNAETWWDALRDALEEGSVPRQAEPGLRALSRGVDAVLLLDDSGEALVAFVATLSGWEEGTSRPLLFQKPELTEVILDLGESLDETVTLPASVELYDGGEAVAVHEDFPPVIYQNFTALCRAYGLFDLLVERDGVVAARKALGVTVRVTTQEGSYRLATDKESRDLSHSVVLETRGSGSAEMLVSLCDVEWAVAEALGIDRADWESCQKR